MDPYETSPLKILASDLYNDAPLYGRYRAQKHDFVPEEASIDNLQYWDTIHQMLPTFDHCRDIFAVGGVIIHSAHLQPPSKQDRVREYRWGDANAVAAADLVRCHLPEIPIPKYYFQGRLRGCDVLIQQRIEGVGLNVAWPYLSLAEKQSFKEQARLIIQKVLGIVEHNRTHPSYVVDDPDPCGHRGITQKEKEILFISSVNDGFGLSHNDINTSNIIVDQGSIVGIVDWEMAGWFGREKAAKVHRQARMVDEASFAGVELTKEKMADLLFWNDLYDC